MPSPLAHGAVGWWLHRRSGLRSAASESDDHPMRLGLLGLAVFWGLSILPDFDFLPGLWLGDPAGWHNGPSHSLLAGVLVAPLVGPLVYFAVGRWLGGGVVRWIGLTLAAYWGHVVLDALTQGRGVKLLWPFLHDRLAPPFAPFYGVRWSEGLLDPTLAWTLANELSFVVLVVASTLWLASRRGREPERAE
ncbi:MAG: metal-dependent hydrolase [Acidobacteriota bacterium]